MRRLRQILRNLHARRFLEFYIRQPPQAGRHGIQQSTKDRGPLLLE